MKKEVWQYKGRKIIVNTRKDEDGHDIGIHSVISAEGKQDHHSTYYFDEFKGYGLRLLKDIAFAQAKADIDNDALAIAEV
jgi:hypothetical protein